jgi:response regulator of citrate/malate metabolism
MLLRTIHRQKENSMSTTEEPGAIEKALTGIRGEIGQLEERRDAMTADLKALNGELRSLRIAERALDKDARPRGTRQGTTADAVRTLMTELGTATQHQVAQALGKPKNSVKHALEQLVAQGVVRPTGNDVRRSPEFELVQAAE